MNSIHPRVDVMGGPTGLRFVRNVYPAEQQMPRHAHEDTASLNFCLTGTARGSLGQRTHLLGPSSLSLMPADVSHANCFSAGTSTFLVVLGAPWVQRLRWV